MKIHSKASLIASAAMAAGLTLSAGSAFAECRNVQVEQVKATADYVAIRTNQANGTLPWYSAYSSDSNEETVNRTFSAAMAALLSGREIAVCWNTSQGDGDASTRGRRLTAVFIK